MRTSLVVLQVMNSLPEELQQMIFSLLNQPPNAPKKEPKTKIFTGTPRKLLF
jgi:hypothetical protein